MTRNYFPTDGILGKPAPAAGVQHAPAASAAGAGAAAICEVGVCCLPALQQVSSEGGTSITLLSARQARTPLFYASGFTVEFT